MDRLLSGYGPEKDKIIVHNSFVWSGIGNQLSCLWGNIALSLVSGRRLRSTSRVITLIIVLWDDYFRLFNSSFNKLRISQNDCTHIILF